MSNARFGEGLDMKQMKLKLPANVSVPAVIMFGDSIVDTGNNNNNFNARCNFLPYGKDFQGGRPTGRYSNGKVPADLFGTYVVHYIYILGLILKRSIKLRSKLRDIYSTSIYETRSRIMC